MTQPLNQLEPDKKPKKPASVPQRQSREMRRAQILRESIAFFAEHGFSGSTHELAKKIGVTQPLLFRYFQSKEDLFEAVFETVFADQWQDDWPRLIQDRSLPLRVRLTSFYHSYLKVVFNRNWMRLYIFAGLADIPLNRRYFGMVEQHILHSLCTELRAEFKMAPPDLLPITDDELDYVWSFHGGIFYHGIRRCAFGTSIDHELNENVLRVSINSFVDAAPHAIVRFLKGHSPT